MIIVTDNAADLTPEEVENLGIVLAPLYIQFHDGEVKAADITPDAFYARLAAAFPKIPTTAQPSSGELAALYEQVAQAGEELFSIHISSGLSGTLNAARLAAEELVGKINVQVVDTMTLSGGQRFQVLAAAMGARAQWTREQILERLAAIREQTEVIFTLETIDYLAKGGRIGRVAAIAGGLLKIKPIIHVDHTDGKYTTVGRARTLGKSIETITEHLSGIYGDTPLWLSVMHGQWADAAESLAGQVKTRLNIARFELLRISPILGVHTGPGIIGICCVPIHHFADLMPAE